MPCDFLFAARLAVGLEVILLGDLLLFHLALRFDEPVISPFAAAKVANSSGSAKSAAEFAPLAELFRREGESLFVPKDGCFSFQQVRNRRSGLVEEGAFRYVHATEAGERHVVGYAFAGEFVGDYISMRNDAPAWVSIEAMCDSRVLTLTGERLEKFYRTDAAHERLGRTVAEHMLAEIYERLLQSYVSTPQERYESLLARCPGLLELVPLRELASFLGVRPETLSRIRRRVR